MKLLGNTQKHQSGKPDRAKQRKHALVAVSFAALLQGCINNYSDMTKAEANRRAASTGESSGDPSRTGSDNSSPIVVTRVVKSLQNPSTMFDLAGDDSGAIGTYCASSGGSTSDGSSGLSGVTGPSTCRCDFTYTKSDGTIESFQTESEYREANLLRCKYIGIPTSIQYVNIRLYMINYQSFSNTVRFRFTSSGVSQDVTNPEAFTKVHRYQCRSIIKIPYLFDSNSGIYDPIQSEDPRFSMSYNFYGSNLGASLSAFINAQLDGGAKPANGAGWYCPPNLINGGADGFDLTLFSSAPDTGGSEVIYPPAGSVFDRSTFYLAKAPAGEFRQSFDALVAPGTATDDDASTVLPNPIGYAAPHIDLGGDTESCPDVSSNIPAGYHWVKVWAFRSSPPDITYFRSSDFRSSGGIYCNKQGRWEDGEPIFPDCGEFTGAANATHFVGTAAWNIANFGSASNYSTFLSDRIVPVGNRNACFRLDHQPAADITTVTSDCQSNSGAGCSTDPTTLAQKSLWGLLAPGSDVWSVRGQSENYNTTRACGTDGASPDPLGVCNGAGMDPTDGIGRVPKDLDPETVSMGNNTSTQDLVYVVTNTNVHTKDMEGNAGLPYKPVRFYSASDCSGNSLATCDLNKRFPEYRLHITNPLKPAGSGNTDRLFPLCAIQPDP